MICTFRNTVTFIRNIYTAILQDVRLSLQCIQKQSNIKRKKYEKECRVGIGPLSHTGSRCGTMIENKPAWLLAGHVGMLSVMTVSW